MYLFSHPKLYQKEFPLAHTKHGYIKANGFLMALLLVKIGLRLMLAFRNKVGSHWNDWAHFGHGENNSVIHKNFIDYKGRQQARNDASFQRSDE